ncbi:hypothetical protein, partial [Escherichia coli]|uniref:hypothetical protein n=1 Tax=Escherichia coli TaxID=562 RepID=UPI003F4AA10C
MPPESPSAENRPQCGGRQAETAAPSGAVALHTVRCAGSAASGATEEKRRHNNGMWWSREKASREFGVTQRTWHAWENAEQVDVTVWRTTQALSVRDLLPHMQGMRKTDII